MCKEEEGREESELLVYIAEHRNPFMECFFCFGLFEDENSKYNISHRHLNVALAFGLMHFAWPKHFIGNQQKPWHKLYFYRDSFF